MGTAWRLDGPPRWRTGGAVTANEALLTGHSFQFDGAVTARTGALSTGIALGLLRQACLNGWRGRFYSAQALLDELYASLADRSTTPLLTELSRLQPLCIDELGHSPDHADGHPRTLDWTQCGVIQSATVESAPGNEVAREISRNQINGPDACSNHLPCAL